MSTAVPTGTPFKSVAADKAMEDPTGRLEIAHGRTPPTTPSRRPHLVIIGAGFGGLSAAIGLGRIGAAVTVIDQRNHHLFQPLLYQVPTAALSPADIGAPIRSILSRQANTGVILGTITGIDVAGRAVLIGERRIPYDHLVIATGARESHFGHNEWAAVTSGLKTIEDAETMRRRILIAFERAEACLDEIEQRRQLTFVIIGGGPTGVELAGALAELAKAALARDFRHIDPTTARIVLVEGGPRLLPTNFSGEPFRGGRSGSDAPRGRSPARHHGDELRRGRRHAWRRANRQPHHDLGRRGRRVARRRLARYRARTWRPGTGRAGLDPAWASRDLRDRRHSRDYRPSWPLPGVAPVAKQQGAYVARLIAARLAGKPSPGPFRYRDLGNLATIGRRAAVADFGRLRLTGRLAWLVWGAAHIYFLIGFRNRIAVATDWLWSYLTYQRGARLITGRDM